MKHIVASHCEVNEQLQSSLFECSHVAWTVAAARRRKAHRPKPPPHLHHPSHALFAHHLNSRVHVLIEHVKVILELLLRHLAVRVHARILVDIGEEDCLRVDGPLVFPRAAVSVATGTDLA